MFDEFEKERTAWDKLDDETAKQHAKFEIYRLLGPSRTLIAAYRKSLGVQPDDESVKTVPGSWKTWFKDFRWRERAEASDAADRKREEEIRQAENDKILTHRYASRFYRIKMQDELAAKLEAEIANDDKLWLRDVKQVGRTSVELVKYNSPLVRDYLHALSEIADEKGERVKKNEVSGPDGAPINTVVILPSNERDTKQS